jgi:hypothetical protein
MTETRWKISFRISELSSYEQSDGKTTVSTELEKMEKEIVIFQFHVIHASVSQVAMRKMKKNTSVSQPVIVF